MATLTVVARNTALIALIGCGTGSSQSTGFPSPSPSPDNSQSSNASSAQNGSTGAAPTATATTSTTGSPAATGSPSAGKGSGSSTPPTSAKDAGTAAAADATVASGSGGGPSTVPMMPAGPMSGNPNLPMVSIPGLTCGTPTLNFGQSAQTTKIDGRDVAVLYPCAHQQAPVTYFMFLHGTLQDAQKIPFTMNAWPIHTLIDQYNIVEVVPQSAMGGTQWGNGDNGTDLPFLYDVVDWVYNTFGPVFDIRSMWVQGGSWGAFYLSSTFACDPKFQSRLTGVQLIVGTGCPTCADRLSCIVGQQELQLGNGNPLTAAQAEMQSDMFNIAPYATKHHCAAKTGPTDVGNVKWWDWPTCDKGWVYNYMMAPGQHADAWDPAAVLKTTQELKAIEQ